MCRRCVQSGRLCGGYSHQVSTVAALRPALRTGVIGDTQTERLCYLASHVLALDGSGCPLQEGAVWGRLFLQLSSQVECVKAATAAFGAAYEILLSDATAEGHSSAWRYYGSALKSLKSDFVNQIVGPESLALSSMILACVEILSQHEQNAFSHFLGAVHILTEGSPGQSVPSTDTLSIVKDALVNFNIIIASYGLSRTPQLMYLEFQDTDTKGDALHEPKFAINAAMLCLYQSYAFIHSAAPLRYKHPSWKELDAIMSRSQAEAADHCRSSLRNLDALAKALQTHPSHQTSTDQASETLADIYALRTQITSALIVILCVHSPYETAYDDHGDLFQSIVSDAAASARFRRRIKASPFRRFFMRPGIVSPLFIVGMKCRDPPLRALAISLLSEQIREGPADGCILAAIGTRLATIEISASLPLSPDAPITASKIHEVHRVYGYMVPHPRFDDDGHRVVDVVFLRPDPPIAQGLGLVDYSREEDWTYWTESIKI